IAEGCRHCQSVGASSNTTVPLRYKDRQLDDATMYGYTPSMAIIDTRTVALGRYFTEVEDLHDCSVFLIGQRVARAFFPAANPLGRVIRAGNTEFTVVGTFEQIGSVLGQDQDNFIVIPLNTYLKLRGQRNSLTLSVKAEGGEAVFDLAQDE